MAGAALGVLAAATLAGCGGAAGAAGGGTPALSITPGISSLDTNCTGCNALDAHGAAVEQFMALQPNGSAARVSWSVAGGDAAIGPGTIDAEGRYTPPSYLTADSVEVMVTARLNADPALEASARVTLTPGFLQPLTPENAALGANGTLTLTGRLAEAGGSAGIRFAVAASPNGVSGAGNMGLGALSPATCERDIKAFTTCTVTYTAPAAVAATEVVYVAAQAGNSRTESAILLNTEGVASNPVDHQGEMGPLLPLGSSGGNNGDFDARGNTIEDCCSGTLGALVEDNSGKQYVLSNDHVLAKSDHATVGDAIVQPGLIDNNCTPNGDGPGTVPVAALSEWLPLKSSATNVDAAIAQVGSRMVDGAGAILELGGRQADGTLGAAPPGTSSTDGRGETASLQMRVAKSGRTTGLTCGGVTAVDLDVQVDYFSDCAETKPYTTKVFTNQVGITGDRLSDAGDSGALVVDTANAEPVGLFFAGGTDAAGVGQGVANPAPEVLSELGAAALNGTSFSFVGGPDHGVSCLSYGNSTVNAAQSAELPDAESERGQEALYTARSLVNPANGILGVAMGKSSDRPGEAAVLVYVGAAAKGTVPATIEGVRTVVIQTGQEAVAMGTAPLDNGGAGNIGLAPSALGRAIRVKQQLARSLMRNPAFFGIGVGQSLDSPREPALAIYVDRNRLPASLPATMDGVRTRYVVMDRLHVTRSYATGLMSRRHCMAHEADDLLPQEKIRF
ncbi:MAG: hypothetical protein WBQ52_07725 [Terracidiphilus sp.]